MNSQPATVLVVKTAGRFHATVGISAAWGDYATIAARDAAALHFGVPAEKISVEPVNATLTAAVIPQPR
ncbi:hypothetical protein [Horticoccus sp. 23ND18S-11]|uniref:hypothetical protein n=1 Tax=Horticoccus sp. 23ND18S-11 TaxID=3391832 RepID=UPI0039C9F819